MIVFSSCCFQGIFSIDLTYEQVKKLRAIQPRTYRNQAYNGKFGIPTLEEYIKLAQSAGRTVGIYPETKHPTFHDSKLKCFKEGSFSMAVKAVLEKYGYKGPINSAAWKAKPAFIQSFETENLKELAKATTIPLVQLLDEWDLVCYVFVFKKSSDETFKSGRRRSELYRL